MARYRRHDQVDLQIAEGLAVDGKAYEVDLIAKKATGVRGFRVTLAFIGPQGGDNAFVDLEPVGTRQEAEDLAADLQEKPDELRHLLRKEKAGSA